MTSGSATVSGIPLSVVKGTGNVGYEGNEHVSDVTASVGHFHVGQVVSGSGIAAGTVINDVYYGIDETSLELSQIITATVTGAELTSAAPSPFVAGESISGAGIPGHDDHRG